MDSEENCGTDVFTAKIGLAPKTGSSIWEQECCQMPNDPKDELDREGRGATKGG